MASSGSKTVKATEYDDIKFSWWFNSGDQSVADNITLVRWKLELIAKSYGYISSSASKDWSVTVNGKKYSGTNTVGISNNSTKTLASGTTTVAHDDDGSKKFSFSFSQELAITFSGSYIGTIKGSGSGTLTTIPRASQPSCITYPEHTQKVGEFGDTISIHMNRKASAFTHTVRYAFGSKTGTIATGVTTGTTWTIPLTLMNLIPSATKGSGTIYVDTYNGSTKIGTKSCGFTATVSSSVIPKCSIQVLDATDVKDTYGNLIKGQSKLYVKTTATKAYGSAIKSYKIIANGKTYTDDEITTDVLAAAGTTTVKATVTDNRGRTSTAATASFTVLDYEKPLITALEVHRCDENGVEDENGENVEVKFSAKITSLNNKNSAAYTLSYTNNTTGAVTNKTLSDIAGNYAPTNYAIIFPAVSDSSYTVKVTAKDDFEEVPFATSVSTAFTLYNCHESGTGWAFGKVAEEENTLEIALETKQIGNSFAFQPSAFSGEKGYTLLAVISLKELNVNAPIVFEINRRGALCPMTVYVRFASSSTTTDPALGSITYEGDNYGAFLYKSGTSTWKLYVDNSSGWSNPCLQKWYTTDNQNASLSVTFPSEQVATLPTPYYRATPAKMQSLLDYIYPVGSIYINDNRDSPADLFGGTWTLVKKEFIELSKSYTFGSSGCPFTKTSNVTSGTIYVVRSGQSLHIRFDINAAVALGDTAVSLGTLNWSALGITSPFASVIGNLGYGDEANAACFITITTDGAMKVGDVLPKTDGGTIAAGNTIYFPFEVVIDSTNMVSSHCDKFYWKRTA